MPGRLILTTVGTSAVDPAKLEYWGLLRDYSVIRISLPQAYRGIHHDWVDKPTPSIQRFLAAYGERTATEAVEEHVDRPKVGGVNAFSAELTSLALLHLSNDSRLTEDDRIVLLGSDTPEGTICALLCKQLLEQRFPTPVEYRSVTGLTPDKFEDFLVTGIHQVGLEIRSARDTNPDRTALLNITGGFKGLIPVLTYVALAQRLLMFFVYENDARLAWVNAPDMRRSLEEGSEPEVEEIKAFFALELPEVDSSW